MVELLVVVLLVLVDDADVVLDAIVLLVLVEEDVVESISVVA